MTATGEFRDYYAEFQIPADASAEEIARQLDAQQRTWAGRASRAPGADKRREAEDKVALIAEARGELLDRARRAGYDRRRAAAQGRRPDEAPPTSGSPRPSASEPRSDRAPRDWLTHAREEMNRGDLDAALYEVRQAVHHDDQSAEAWQLLGALHLATGQIRDALQELQRSLKLAPRDALTHSFIGIAYENLNDIHSAASWHLKAMELKPASTDFQFNAANALYTAGRYDEALHCYEKCLAWQPDNASVRDQIARIWLLRAEGAKTYNTLTGQRLITSAESAQQIGHIVEQAFAVQPADQEVCRRLANEGQAAVAARKKTWRLRPAAIPVSIGCLVLDAVISTSLLQLLLVITAIAFPAWYGWKPRWQHARNSLSKKPNTQTGSHR